MKTEVHLTHNPTHELADALLQYLGVAWTPTNEAMGSFLAIWILALIAVGLGILGGKALVAAVRFIATR